MKSSYGTNSVFFLCNQIVYLWYKILEGGRSKFMYMHARGSGHLNYGEGGGATKGRVGQVKFYPYEKRGRKKF